MIPAICHPDRPANSFGLCRACYRKHRRAKNIEKFRQAEKENYQKNKGKIQSNQRRHYEKKKAQGVYATPEFKEKKRLYNALPRIKARAKEYDRRKHLSKLGLSVVMYDAILAKQGGACAICNGTCAGRRDRHLLYVDHDHVSGKVRGLLCHSCNFGIGHFKDNPMLLESAANYLRRSSLSSMSDVIL